MLIEGVLQTKRLHFLNSLFSHLTFVPSFITRYVRKGMLTLNISFEFCE